MNPTKQFCNSCVALLDISDHFDTIVVMIAKATKSDKTKRYQIRDMSKFDHEKFLQNLTNDLNTNAPNSNESVHNQFEIFSNNVNTCTPSKNASRRKKRLIAKPWLSEDLVNSITRKNKLFIKLQKCFVFCFICHIYPPFTRKRIVSLYFGREVRTRLGVAFFEVFMGHLSST